MSSSELAEILPISTRDTHENERDVVRESLVTVTIEGDVDDERASVIVGRQNERYRMDPRHNGARFRSTDGRWQCSTEIVGEISIQIDVIRCQSRATCRFRAARQQCTRRVQTCHSSMNNPRTVLAAIRRDSSMA